MAMKQFMIDDFLSKKSKKKSETFRSVVIIDSGDSEDDGLRGQRKCCNGQLPRVEPCVYTRSNELPCVNRADSN